MRFIRTKIRQSWLLFTAFLLMTVGICVNSDFVLAADGSMTVHFLDVGQGLSILVESEGQTLLYDGGPRSASSYVVSYLQEKKIDEINAAMHEREREASEE